MAMIPRERAPYSAIVDRPPLRLPGRARVVVWTIVNLEVWDIARAMPPKSALFGDADEWVNAGDTVVVAPGGKIAAGPLHEAFGILYAEIDLERVGMARRSLDVAGHYARPDIFRLQVNRRPQAPVMFEDHDNLQEPYETIE